MYYMVHSRQYTILAPLDWFMHSQHRVDQRLPSRHSGLGMVTWFGCSPTVEPQQSCARTHTQLWARQDAGTRRARPESRQDGSWFIAQRAVGLAWALDWAEHRESGTASGTSTFFFRTGLTRGVPRTFVSQMPYQPLALALCIHIARLGSPSAPRPSSERNHSTPSALRSCYLPPCPPFSRSSPARIGVLTALLTPSWVALTPERLLSRL